MALNPIDRLQRDHANMGRVLALIRLQLDLLALNAKLDLNLLANSAYYMRKYPSVVHHPKEDLVFEKLLELGGPARAEVQRLESEHQELYRLEDQLIEFTLAVQAGKTRARAQLLETCRFYLLTQAQHMRTEERVVFPATLRCFKTRDWRAIEAQCRKIDDPLFGKKVGVRYRRLYDFLIRSAADAGQGLALMNTAHRPA